MHYMTISNKKNLKKNSVSHHSIPSPRASLMAFVASNVDIVQRPGRTQCYVRGIRRNKCNRYLAHRHRKIAAGRIRRCNLPGSRGELDTVKKTKCFWTFWTLVEIVEHISGYCSSTMRPAKSCKHFKFSSFQQMFCFSFQPSNGYQKNDCRDGLHRPAHAKNNLKMEPSGCKEIKTKVATSAPGHVGDHRGKWQNIKIL